ncbi:hypothetical protein EO087_15700 [Dyella sp. M7H15-1]|uniref:hypothetical protein n=1 Tax=Dyella sp. M7H15-1 TaxID=2501295 RepID=UPI00100518DB|nr:hypothetical protein [Dyella sp. M7H15-1]QAU25254.1 hypothetical protein EO087_15700 [Dyella sp. M7H15-1]
MCAHTSDVRVKAENQETKNHRKDRVATEVALTQSGVKANFVVEPDDSSPDGTVAGSLYYEPQFRFRLLPTPPHGDAVTFRYGACG